MRTRTIATLLAAAALASSATRAQDQSDFAGDVYNEVVRLRGLQLSDVPEVRTPTAMDMRRKLEARLMPRDRRRYEMLHSMLAMLGFVPPRLDSKRKMSAVLLAQGDAFFDAKSHAVLLNPKAERYGDFVRRMLVAAAWARALDEKFFGVSKMLDERRGNLDKTFAMLAVARGSGAGMMQQWAVENRAGRKMPELLAVKKLEDARNRASFEAPLFFSTRMAAQLMGLHFLTRGKGSASLLPDIPVGVSRNAEAAYKRPPESSEQVLHPEKYWTPESRDRPVRMRDENDFVSRLAHALGKGFTLQHKDCLGEFFCGIVARSPLRRVRPEQMRKLVGKPRYWSGPASMGWGGDRVFVADYGGERGILWISWWDSDRDAAEFAKSYQKFVGRRLRAEVSRKGRLVVSGFGSLRTKASLTRKLAEAHGHALKGRSPFPLRDSALGSPR